LQIIYIDLVISLIFTQGADFYR